MKVFEGFGQSGEIMRPVATIGSYDGVHVGHREILTRLKARAAQLGGQSTVITFHPHPRQVLTPEDPLFLLTTLPEKLDLLASLGIDHVIVVPFTAAFSRMSASDFVRNCLVKQLHVDTLIVGYNHHLGRDKTGDAASLQQMGMQLGFRVEEMPRQSLDEHKVSSTWIRSLVAEGAMTQAARYLGAPYSIRGVLRNHAVTDVDPLKLLPAEGEYSVCVATARQRYEGRLSVKSDRKLLLQSSSGDEEEGPVTVKFI